MRKLPVFLLAVLLIIALPIAAAGSGTSVDPLVSLSYLNSNFVPKIKTSSDEKITGKFSALPQTAQARLDALLSEKTGRILLDTLASGVETAILNRIAASGGSAFLAGQYTDITLQMGDTVAGVIGTGLLLKQGGATVLAPNNGEVLNLTAGAAARQGNAIASNAYYMTVANEGTGFTASKDQTIVLVSGAYTVKKAYTAQYTSVADGLKQLGLFLGTNSGFELDRAATRVEALVMLTRLLGEEQAALAFDGANPFKDVDTWADRYAAYAWAKGYTKGVSADRFDPSAAVTIEQYVTFVLRALSYNDAAGDFAWDSASQFAVQVGLITEQERTGLLGGRFLRDHVVYLSRNALYTKIKGLDATLSDNLIANGAISAEIFESIGSVLKNSAG